MARCGSEAVEMLNSEDGVKRLEAILAAYLTDGYYNGIAIGVRNIDPMIFRHLADLGLVKTVFPVRGTGNTWSLGAYFPKRLSEATLSCLEEKCKQTARIKPEVLQRLDIDRFMAWIIEYESSVFINRWGKEIMLLITICQYEDTAILGKFPKTCGRARLSVSETSQVLQGSGITPSQLWLDDVINRFTTNSPIGAVLKYYKEYRLDITTKAAIDHQHIFYLSYREAGKALHRLIDLTLPASWKHMTVQIYAEALLLYVMRQITFDDIKLLKRVIACNYYNPMKGPYNEYVITSLDKIRDFLEYSECRRATNYQQKMQQFRNYFEKRRKSYATLNTMLSARDRKRLSELENMVASLSELLTVLRGWGTPKGCLNTNISQS